MSQTIKQLAINCAKRKSYMTCVIFNAIRDGGFIALFEEENPEEIAPHTLLAVLQHEKIGDTKKHGLSFAEVMRKIGRNEHIEVLLDSVSRIGGPSSASDETIDSLFRNFAEGNLGARWNKIDIDLEFVQRYGFAMMIFIIAVEAYTKIVGTEFNAHLARVLQHGAHEEGEEVVLVQKSKDLREIDEMIAKIDLEEKIEKEDLRLAQFLQEEADAAYARSLAREDGAAPTSRDAVLAARLQKEMEERAKQIADDENLARELTGAH